MKTTLLIALSLIALSSCAHKKYVDCMEGNPTACYSLDRKCTGGNEEACKKLAELPLAQKRSIWWEYKKRDMVPPQWVQELPELSEAEKRDMELSIQAQSLEEQKRANRIQMFQAVQAAQPQRVQVEVKQPSQPYMLPTKTTTNCTSQRIGNQVQTVCR